MLINLLLWLIDKIDFFSGKQQENEYWICLGRVENVELLEYTDSTDNTLFDTKINRLSRCYNIVIELICEDIHCPSLY